MSKKWSLVLLLYILHVSGLDDVFQPIWVVFEQLCPHSESTS